MAVRRGPRPKPVSVGAAALLSWSRHRRVPAALLEHPDPEVRVLAEATDEAVIAFRCLLCLEPNSLLVDGLKAEKDRQWARLASIRRGYAEARGLKWEHPDPFALGFPRDRPASK
jgi:hypothetical protein